MTERDIGIGSLLKTAREAYQYQSCAAPLDGTSTGTRPMVAGDGWMLSLPGYLSRGQIVISLDGVR
jgi:hypothetical protein